MHENNLSQIRATKPGCLPLYQKRNPLLFSTDNEYKEKIRACIQKSEKKLDRKSTRKELQSIQSYFDNNNCSRKMFNRLMSDVRCLDKIVFVTDGSNCFHRILVTSEDVTIDICEGKSERYFLSRSRYSTKLDDSKTLLRKFSTIISRSEKIFIEVKTNLSQIRQTKPGCIPLYERRNIIRFSTDEKYAQKLIGYIPKSEENLNRELTRKKLQSIESYFDNNNCSRKIFNRLMSDVRCLDKIVFVNDGSYRFHRILVTSEDVTIDIFEGKCKRYVLSRSRYSTKCGDSKTLLRKFSTIIYRSEKIFIQVVEENDRLVSPRFKFKDGRGNFLSFGLLYL